jgi:hypothetical protein
LAHKDSNTLMIDLKKHELSRLLHSKFSNESVFQANLTSLHNVRDHPNTKILAPQHYGESYNHSHSIVLDDNVNKDDGISSLRTIESLFLNK